MSKVSQQKIVITEKISSQHKKKIIKFLALKVPTSQKTNFSVPNRN